MTDARSGHLSLETSGYVDAAPQRVFDAWTTPAELVQWWGPEGVRCLEAHVDLRIGGRYRIANELPDRAVLWITGEFEDIEIPERLVFSWRVADRTVKPERVTVRFRPEGAGTRVTVLHERIATEETSRQHRAGWQGCLEGLAAHCAG